MIASERMSLGIMSTLVSKRKRSQKRKRLKVHAETKISIKRRIANNHITLFDTKEKPYKEILEVDSTIIGSI